MIKDFNAFITEDKEYNEIFTLVEEVLSNDYSNREIEESFDEFNLLLESISKVELKELIKTGNIQYKEYENAKKKWDEKIISHFKKRDELRKKMDNPENKGDFNKLKEFSIEHNKLLKELDQLIIDQNKELDDISKDKDKKFKRYSFILDIISAYKSIQQFGIKVWSTDDGKELIKTLFTTLGLNNLINMLTDDICGTVDKELKLIDEKYKEIKKEIPSIIDDVKDVCELLKLEKYGLLFEDDRGIVWDPKKLYNGVIVKLLRNAGCFSKHLENDNDIFRDIEDILNDEDDKPIEYTKPSKEELKKAEEIVNSSKESKSEESEEKQIEPTKEDVSDVISDNKDLLTPLAKEANVTADQLSNIVSKLCLTKTGKSRKLDSGVVTGLSIIICGVLLTVKKNGKNDRKAIVDVINKISELIEQKKGFKKILQ